MRWQPVVHPMAQRAWWPCERRSIRCSAAADPAITRLSNGHYYNQRLGAHNVWEVELDASLVDEAGAIVSEGSPFAQLVGWGAAYVPITTRRGDHFFAHRVSQWNSNICWISCDNARAFDRFNRLFSRMGLAEYFGGVVPHARSLQMYNAFYVTRSWCKEHNFHTDYSARVGTNALTLITPVADYREKDSFQLSYEKRGAEHLVGQRGTPPELARYTYKKGTAIVFGSGCVFVLVFAYYYLILLVHTRGGLLCFLARHACTRQTFEPSAPPLRTPRAPPS